MRKRLFILCAIISILAPTSHASETPQHYYFNHYTTQDGLPSNTVYSVVQDKLGFIWVSTRDGLARFDGSQFAKMTENDPEGLMSGNVTMCVDENGVIWLSSKNKVGSYDPLTGVIRSIGEFGTGSGGSARSSTICSDSKQNIWFVTDNLYRYNKETGEIKEYPREEYIVPSSMVSDSFGTAWFLSGGTLCRYDSRTDSFEEVPITGLKYVEATREGSLLACSTANDIMVIDPHTLVCEVLLQGNEISEWRNVLCLTEREPGEYWIGTETGVLIYTEGQGLVNHIQESSEDKHAISASYVMRLFSDKDGNIWAGTYYTGLNLWQDRKGAFQLYYDYKSSNSLKGNIVRPIKTDSEGMIWIGTEDGELNKYDPVSHKMVTYPEKETFYNIQDLLPYKGDIWVASYGNGLFRYNPDSRRIVARYSLESDYVTRLFLTARKEVLAGTRNGLYKFNESTGTFETVSATEQHFIHSIYQDHRGNIWVGTIRNGIRVMDQDYNLLVNVTASDESALKAGTITSIFEDSKDRIWLSTEGGGVFYTSPDPDLTDIKLTNISMNDGLTSDNTCAIAEDRDGLIWISSTQGIACFNPETSKVTATFFEKSQITGGQYTLGSSCTMPNGTIYMGTTDGMVSFSPTIIKGIISETRLYITQIKATTSDKTLNLSSEGRSAFTSDKIKVKAKDISTLEISFSVPDYSGIMDVEYQYSLSKRRSKGYNSKTVTTDSKALFTNITPGQYTFNVEMVGCDWEGTGKQLEIRVIPPFYDTMAAWIFYMLLILAAVWAAIRLISEKRENDRKRSIANLENEKQKEIYDAKIKYFTNLTHEIRTPLSLIKMPVDKILNTEGYKASAREDMLTIKANTERLLELTNQLLDLRKVEQKELKLIFTREDMRNLVLKTCDYFTTTARERHIDINVSTPDSPVNVMCGAESIKKIISNLLSNAIKYGKDKIDVILTEDTEAGMVSVRVNSNGVRIANADKARIFEPFYQARMSDDQLQGSNGTGLGLPFAKSLAELHSGRLYLDETITDMNSFVLEIPEEQPDAVHIKADDDKNSEAFSQIIDSSRHTVLVVEDSPEMRTYLGKELSEEYNTLLTANGEEALKTVQEQKVDLVISDIMMPVMDGCELCNRIKTDIDYCHIPVILLTAAVGVETRIETLEVGADGYIEKPFSIDLLKANISNIFKNKEISFRQFTQSPLSHYNGVVVNSMDDDFMDRLHSEVMKHLSEQDLNIEALTSILGTSKSTLYRKIKANTGLNINEYIRLCRLKEAAEMLSSQKYRINEVAYLVGFSSPSYFTTSFQKQFNISPSAFVKRIKQED